MKRISRKGWAGLPVVAVVSAGAIGIAALAERPSLVHAAPLVADSSAISRATTAPTGSVARLDELSDAFATIAAKIKPSGV